VDFAKELESLRATKELHCKICSTSDKGTNRVVVQCNAGDKGELPEIKNKHADMTQDACARALHVGCAHYRPEQAALSHRKVIGDNRKPQTFFFPGSQEGKYSEPVSAVYCIKHLGEIKMCHKKKVGSFAELTEILKKEKKAQQETRTPEKTGYVYIEVSGGRLSEDDGGKPKKRKKEKEKEKGLEANPQKEVSRKKKQDASLLSTTTTTTTVAPPKTSPSPPPPRLSPSPPPTPQNPLPTEAAPKKAASPAVRKSSSKKATPTPDNVWGADG
jgi:hypothetical protein